ncbi:Interferon-induced GTP-binding protein Mx1 [Paramyrothecium foliicola]|nr:Interferon-induced GTP-binding protein Mx1 [Paramyrothecium foliicola]
MAPSTPTRAQSPEAGSSSLGVASVSPTPSVDSGVGDIFGSPRPKSRGGKDGAPGEPTSNSEDERANSSGENRRLMTHNPFESDRARILFKAVDELQEWKAQRFVAIPQLVIVGGQSSGKSSLLKGLTGIPFPVSGKCCTRFPTRILCKRTAPGKRTKYKITIEAPEVEVMGLAYLDGKDCTYTSTGGVLTEDIFSQVLEEVSEKIMGISSGQGADKRNFVSNVLKIEISGPQLTPLSILDLPGIISAANTVKEEEKEGVTEMVTQYMRQPQNIIICVVSAHTDLDHQDILKLASRHAEPDRIVGVLTKCDKVDEPEVKAHWTDFALNRIEASEKVTGDNWFVVRNRHTMDPESFDIEAAEEQIFEASPWSSIPQDRRGTSILRTHIASILTDKLRADFPKIRRKIEKRLADSSQKRAGLGEPRNDFASKQKFIIDHVNKIAKIINRALNNSTQLPEEQMRLVPIVSQLNSYFDASARSFGHVWSFESDKSLESGENHRTGIDSISSASLSLLPVALRNKASFTKEYVEVLPTESFLSEITDEFLVLQANQLPGVINPAIYPIMYSKQALKWKGMALQHLQCVHDAVDLLIRGAIRTVCPPEGGTRVLHQELTSFVTSILEESHKEACEFIISFCEKETNPEHTLQSTYPGFHWKEGEGKTDMQLGLMFNFIHHTNPQNMQLEVHDVLQVYYELSLEHFIREVTATITDNFIQDKSGPLKVLNADTIRSWSEVEVNRFAREEESTMYLRKDLDEKISTSKQALRIVVEALEQTM